MPTAVEIFAGCGGLSSGLENAGFQILSAVEIRGCMLFLIAKFSAGNPKASQPIGCNT